MQNQYRFQKKEDQKHIITTVTLRNFRYASRENSCGIHNSIVSPTRLSCLAILQSSVDDITLD